MIFFLPMLKWLCLFLSLLAAGAVAQSAPSATEQSAGSDPVYKVGADVTAPVPVYRPEPEISEQSRVQKRSGIVTLTAIIRNDGRVGDVKITGGYDPEFDAAALKALKQWTFDPARKDGVPVAVKVNIEVAFNIGYDGEGAMRDWQSQLCTRAYPGTIAAGSPAAAMQAGAKNLVRLSTKNSRPWPFRTLNKQPLMVLRMRNSCWRA